jgi:4-hydroxybenzoate polyprenyltransferase
MTGDVTARRPDLHPLDFIFLLRPSALVPLWIFQLAGVAAAAEASQIALGPLAIPRHAALGLAAMTLVLGGGYVLNQISDVESDRANRKLFLLPLGIVSIRAAWIELAVVWAAGAAISLALSVWFRWILAASLVLNITYSVGPVSAKSRAPLDLVWNGLEFGLVAFAAGLASMAPLVGSRLWPGLSYALAVAGCIASTTILDIPGDIAQGCATTGAVLGARRTSLLAIALVLVAATIGWLIDDATAFYGSVLAVPLLVRAHVSRRNADRSLANQVGIGVFALLVGARTPLMLAVLAVAYFGTRGYYRARFGLALPRGRTP